jgi:ABC-2 type transport system permease protein
MHNLLRLSWLNVKNKMFSRIFLFGIACAFAYPLLWVFAVNKKYQLDLYCFEMGRFMYVIMLYAAVSLLRDDIKNNTTKTVFTGVFSRTEIMISKAISLVIWGCVFAFLLELNNIIVSAILHKTIGINGFLSVNHVQLFINYIVILFSMGGLMLLIASIAFNDSKNILFYILLLGMVNFFTSAVVTAVHRNPELKSKFIAYIATPFYNAVELTSWDFNAEAILINVLWGIGFIAMATLIINKREIK